MKKIISIALTLSLFLSISSKFSEEQMESLKKKYTKKISVDNINKFDINRFSSNKKLSDQIPYDPEIIKEIMDSIDVPENYNFLNATGTETIIKDQQSCGCCWSHSSTTALAYRYALNGINVSLSPQNALSCYLRDCDAGNYLIDSAMNLVKNGTVTESCFPFASGDGKTIPQCPNTCADGSEYKKYYAQSVYMTEQIYSKENFYDIVKIILDQIYRHGPVVTGIDVYADFSELCSNPEKCKEEVYSYDGKSSLLGGHAVAVVGYGKLGDKYYWLLQNSWGPNACDGGFIKVEFGQVGVENVAFIEPYLPNEESVKKEVKLTYKSIDENCYMTVSSSDDSNWENTVEINFINQDHPDDRTFNMQCNIVKFHDHSEPACFYEEYNGEFMHKGKYKFVGSKSLGTENYFTLDNTFENASFEFLGDNYVYPIFSEISYVSKAGSQILLYHDYSYGIEYNMPPILPTSNSIPLSNCKPFNLPKFGLTMVNCIISEDELKLFQKVDTPSDETVDFKTNCGQKVSTGLTTYLLDLEKYPVFMINKFLIPPNNTISYETPLYLVSEIQGNVKKFVYNNYFYVFADIEAEKESDTYPLECHTGIPTEEEKEKEYNLTCLLLVDDPIKFNKITLKTVYSSYLQDDPYDIIIPQEIQGEPYNDNKSFSSMTKVSVLFVLGLLFLF